MKRVLAQSVNGWLRFSGDLGTLPTAVAVATLLNAI